MSADEKFNPGERCAIKCQKCAELWLNATVQQARIAGWRVWDGTSVTGLPLSVVVCPVCAGMAPANADGEPEGYDAVCNTCDASMVEEDPDDDEPFTADEAKNWCRRHECEPETHVIPPKAAVAPPGLENVTVRAGIL